jgi:hypothetical protein
MVNASLLSEFRYILLFYLPYPSPPSIFIVAMPIDLVIVKLCGYECWGGCSEICSEFAQNLLKL